MSKKAANNEAPVRVLKNGTCPNLSGKSTLSYRIGVNEVWRDHAAASRQLEPGLLQQRVGALLDCPGVAGQAGSGQGDHVVCADAAVPGQDRPTRPLSCSPS